MDSSGTDEVRQAMETLARNGIARGVLQVVDDRGKMQLVQVSLLDGELADGAERFQNYGYTSVPDRGSESVVVFIGADRSHPVVVVADDRRVRKAGLLPGEVAVYHKDGDFIHLKNGNEIEISTKKLTISAADEVKLTTKSMEVTASTGITIKTPSMNTTGATGGVMSSTMNGTLTTTSGDIIADGVHLKTHTHRGVQTGSGHTGAPD